MKLRCENLVKKYGMRTVVKGVSMEVSQGEIVGFLGPNGAGKTTSFYMITGQIVPNEGKVFLDDEEITNLPMYKRAQKGVGYLPQDASVFRKMSVEDNIVSVMASFPEVSAAAARSPGLWPSTRSSSCSTNLSPAWTPSRWRISST